MSTTPTTPPTVQERISLATSENNRLCQILRETDYAPATIRQTNSHVSTVAARLKTRNSLVLNLERQRKELQAANQNYRDSKMRRFTYNLAGKKEQFDEKTANVEKAFLDTTRKHEEAVRDVEYSKAELAETRKMLMEAEKADSRRTSALAELDKLHDDIFEGPTPEFPEEDQAEYQIAEACLNLEKAQEKLKKEERFYQRLSDASRELDAAYSQVRKAADASERCLGMTGHTYMDLEEQAALKRAKKHCNEMEALMRQARDMNPELEPLGPMNIPKPHSRSNPWLNNYFEEESNLRNIENSAKRLSNAARKMTAEKWGAQRKVGWEKMQTEKAQMKIREEKDKLREVRQGIFQQVTGSLPEYQP
ncbi:hypothetical protein FQN54_002135 [Arachnomyces sp. PD_36]|nr:hypothetical protein FQN54_002135 [Arachnomyces sp. PD_36]